MFTIIREILGRTFEYRFHVPCVIDKEEFEMLIQQQFCGYLNTFVDLYIEDDTGVISVEVGLDDEFQTVDDLVSHYEELQKDPLKTEGLHYLECFLKSPIPDSFVITYRDTPVVCRLERLV